MAEAPGWLEVDEAVRQVKSGDTLALGGLLLENRPCALVRALIRHGIGDLTVVCTPVAGWDVDVLIAAGLVKKLYVGHLSLGPVGLAPAFSGSPIPDIEVVHCDEAILVGGFLAAAERLPSRTLSSVAPNDVNDACALVRGVDEEGMTIVEAIAPDVAFLHAPLADRAGNIHYRASRYADAILARASRLVVASVDEVVESRPQGVVHSIPSYLIDTRTVAPNGGWPGGVVGSYRADFAHLSLYQSMMRGGFVNGYLDEYVRGASR